MKDTTRGVATEEIGLPWVKARGPHRWLDARLSKVRRVRDHATRALGLLCVLLRAGPAKKEPLFHRALHRLGVLDSDPGDAEDSPLLEKLPWGTKTVAAPAPARPRDVSGMWPQPPVFHPDIYPGVLHLDGMEIVDHVRTNSLRYVGQIVALTPGAAWRARTRPRVRSLDDTMFSRLLTETSLAQHLRFTAGARDRAAFARVMEGGEGQYATIDFSGVQPGPTLPWVNLSPTVTLFRHEVDGRFVPLAIRVGDEVVTPDQGDAWVLARYQVLSGAHVQHTVIVHPRLHFPGDCINALSKSLLPANHLLARLILPHTRLSLGLDLAVLHHRRSVLYNSQREIYTPLPLSTEGIVAAVKLGREGTAESDAYPAYDFWGIPHDARTRFGRYCREWQDAFERFAVDVTRRIPAGDPDVVRWADAIHEWVPGFPDGRQIFEGDCLGRAASRYLATITVLHSADHYSYSEIPIEYLPMRIRKSAPGERSGRVDVASLVSAGDFFRHVLCHRMFFTPVVAESLDEVRHAFEDAGARAAARSFRDAMTRLDERWRGSGFPASYEIASSIQY